MTTNQCPNRQHAGSHPWLSRWILTVSNCMVAGRDFSSELDKSHVAGSLHLEWISDSSKSLVNQTLALTSYSSSSPFQITRYAKSIQICCSDSFSVQCNTSTGKYFGKYLHWLLAAHFQWPYMFFYTWMTYVFHSA